MGAEIWRERVLWWGYTNPHTHPHTQLKKSGFPISIPNQCGDFPSKWGQVRTIHTRTGLFTISKYALQNPSSLNTNTT